jgi:hypothetical protein
MEGSTPSEMEKEETSNRGGTGNVEVLASSERVNVRWMKVRSECGTTGSSGTLAGNCSRRAGFKKGADVTAGEVTTRGATETTGDTASTATEKKRNGDAPLGYSGRTALRREQCDVDGSAGSRGHVNSAVS